MSRSKPKDFVQVLRVLEFGYLSGRDWKVSLRDYVTKTSPEWLQEFDSRLRSLGQQEALEQLIRSNSSLEMKVLSASLIESSRSGMDAYECIRDLRLYAQNFERIHYKLLAETYSLRLQVLFFALICIFLSFLPGRLFSLSYLQLGLENLFFLSVGAMSVGIFFSAYFLRRIDTDKLEAYQLSVFFKSLGLLLSCGLNFSRSWSRASQISFGSKSQLKFQKPVQLSWREFLSKLRMRGAEEMEWLGLVWVLEQGAGLESYCYSVAQDHSERLMPRLEILLKRRAFFALLSLVLLAFPAAVSLIMGPYLMKFFLELGHAI